MYFYEVWVRSRRYRGEKALTYQSTQRLTPGSLVNVPLQRENAVAIIIQKVSQPEFACKNILTTYDLPPLPEITLQLLQWLQVYYPAPIGPLTQLVLPASLKSNVTPTEEDLSTGPIPIELNTEQSAAIRKMRQAGTYILHGRTGSGKTRVYAALAKEVLEQGRSALILSPEISLTPQLAQSIRGLLAVNVVVFHSKMTIKQRSEAWLQILTTTVPLVVVGPRSALFTPLASIGLIVLDEFHEPAYKQEQQPYYYAPRVAAQLAKLHAAKLILGSATPTVVEYYLAQQKQRPIITMAQLAVQSPTKTERILVDLKDRTQFLVSAHLSDPLITALRQGLRSGEQSLLYLNRRGTARMLLCNICGWQALCPHCDLAVTYHNDLHALLCHTCGYRTEPLSSCPTCGNTDIIFKTAGTKAIAQEVSRLFPEARVQRFDTDNLKAERFEQHFESVKSGQIDILIGTQLLAKGLDLPKLTTLGVILADSSLNIPDYTAGERTYQLLTQVLGRIGRGHSAHATAVVQSYDPTNTAIAAALEDNWESFYCTEIAERQQFMFPPFCYLLKLSCQRASAVSAEKACLALQTSLQMEYANRSLQIDGPAPAFHEKLSDKYQWQLVLKSKNRSVLLDVVKKLPKSGWTYDIDPINLL